MIGNGVKWSYFGRLLVTGTSAITNILTCMDDTNFPALTFESDPTELYDYDAPTGVFTFKRRGLLDIAATLNINSTTGNTEAEIVTEYDDQSGGGFVKQNARIVPLPVIGGNGQTSLEGTLEQIKKGDKLRFFVRSPDGSASFVSLALPDTSPVPAVIMHMKLYTR